MVVVAVDVVCVWVGVPVVFISVGYFVSWLIGWFCFVVLFLFLSFFVCVELFGCLHVVLPGFWSGLGGFFCSVCVGWHSSAGKCPYALHLASEESTSSYVSYTSNVGLAENTSILPSQGETSTVSFFSALLSLA